MAQRRARAVWEGNLVEGRGRVSAESSRVFADLPVTWASRTEEPAGMTSPEELIAAAHAGCFAMAFSNELAGRGHPPSRLEVTATSAFDKVEEGFKFTRMEIEVAAEVPDIDEATFNEALKAADEGCPVSVAMRGGVEIRVSGSLK